MSEVRVLGLVTFSRSVVWQVTISASDLHVSTNGLSMSYKVSKHQEQATVEPTIL